MKISRTVSFGMGAVMALVIGSGTAYAATGGKFILGKSNTAGKTTTLTSKNGAALSLNSPLGAPPLKVNRSITVPNLSSDLLDGMDQSQFALASGTVKAYDAPAIGYDLDGSGKPETFIAEASCPAGTRRTGGGATDGTDFGVIVANAPDPKIANAWAVVVYDTDEAAETQAPSAVKVSVVCYSPRGVPVAGYRVAAPSITPSSELMALAARKVNARR
jgi:hypothetical protein